ncbi:MAG: cation:proton antiporter [Rhodoferax sp.]|uniref:cation:proton antiporter domain-containing protein n=1 Tax=Rhodoferax sp. TaxID=50421 RepID=UPI001B66BE7A|nr:cation:proton antiporter [Rhodoferax sp.]
MLVTLIGFALVFGLVFSRIGLPPMVGFLLAGFAYNITGLTPPECLQWVANLGITLMLFSIGLKLDFRGLAKPEIWADALTCGRAPPCILRWCWPSTHFFSQL